MESEGEGKKKTNEEGFRWTRDLPPPWTMTTTGLGKDNLPPHNWLCDGRILVLTDPGNKDNLKLFQKHWTRGQPLIVANVSHTLDMNLWRPSAFNEQFGSIKHDLINCKTGKVVPQIPLKWFWDGFDCLDSRMLDNSGMPMLLKLKDWP